MSRQESPAREALHIEDKTTAVLERPPFDEAEYEENFSDSDTDLISYEEEETGITTMVKDISGESLDDTANIDWPLEQAEVMMLEENKFVIEEAKNIIEAHITTSKAPASITEQFHNNADSLISDGSQDVELGEFFTGQDRPFRLSDGNKLYVHVRVPKTASALMSR